MLGIRGFVLHCSSTVLELMVVVVDWILVMLIGKINYLTANLVVCSFISSYSTGLLVLSPKESVQRRLVDLCSFKSRYTRQLKGFTFQLCEYEWKVIDDAYQLKIH